MSREVLALSPQQRYYLGSLYVLVESIRVVKTIGEGMEVVVREGEEVVFPLYISNTEGAQQR